MDIQVKLQDMLEVPHLQVVIQEALPNLQVVIRVALLRPRVVIRHLLEAMVLLSLLLMAANHK